MHRVAARDAAVRKVWLVLRSNSGTAVGVDDCTHPISQLIEPNIGSNDKMLHSIGCLWSKAFG